MTVVLVGAGGHAKGVAEALALSGHPVAVYVDPKRADWLKAAHRTDDAAVTSAEGVLAMGVGGVAPANLKNRLALLDRYLARGFDAPPVIHPAAVVSGTARLAAGAIVLAGAIVQPDARIGRGALVNTGAVVEHDSVVEEGAHVGPGAIVLGGVTVGACCMIGAGAVVLPGAAVPAMTTVAAATRFGGADAQLQAERAAQ
jgi:sugar O-acyltransferase (sialic acid O-acetyltransferase NeuD family)